MYVYVYTIWIFINGITYIYSYIDIDTVRSLYFVTHYDVFPTPAGVFYK